MSEKTAEDLWHPGQGWGMIAGTPFSRYIGPFYRRQIDCRPQFCLRIDERHDNSHGRAHGGVVMSFADEALGLAGRSFTGKTTIFTIEFDCRFLSGIMSGDVVEIAPELIKETRSLLFLRGDCTVNGQVVASCTGVWKILNKD